MKNVIITVLLIFVFSFTYSQPPQSFNYQGVLRNSTGTPIVNTNVSVRISIIDQTATGSILYQETHALATNSYGIFNLAVGTGFVVQGSFNSINWSSGDKFIQTEFDPNGGSNYTISGTTQILSVPYSLFSANSSNGTYLDRIFVSTPISPSVTSPTGHFNLKNARIWINQVLTLSDSAGSFAGNHLNMWIDNTTQKAYISGRGTPSPFPLIIQTNQFGTPLGNVGIGMDNPYHRLQVDGNIGFTTRGQKLIFAGSPSDSDCYITRPIGTDGILMNANDIYIQSKLTPVQVLTPNNFVVNDLNSNPKFVMNVQNNRIGIGTSSPSSSVTVVGGDVEVKDINSGLILRSPNGSCWRLTIDDNGNIIRTSITCP